jgi:hypothetical protein
MSEEVDLARTAIEEPVPLDESYTRTPLKHLNPCQIEGSR